MSIKGFSIFSSGSRFVLWSDTILAIMVEGHPRNISVELFPPQFSTAPSEPGDCLQQSSREGGVFGDN